MAFWLKNYRAEAVLALLLLFVSTWHLASSPATWFDEGINIGIAKSLVEHGVYSLEIAPNEFVQERHLLITTNYPVLLPVALSLKLFGPTIVAARFPMVLFLWGFVVAAYLLVRWQYSREAALWSIALLISFVPLYGNGKPVQGEVPGLFFLLLGLLALPVDFKWRRLLLAGLFFGLAVATKPFFLIILVALGIGECIAHHRSGFLLKRLAILDAGCALPITGWLYTIVPAWSLDGAQRIFSFYANSYASSDVASLVIENFVRFFTESTPLHFLILFFALGALLWRKKKRCTAMITETEVILGVFVLLTLVFYLKTPGWYRYFFPAHLALFLFFPAALSVFVGRKVALALVAGLFLVQSTHLFLQRNETLYESREAEETAQRIMETTKLGERVLLINQPSAAFLLKDRAVYQYLEINPVLHFGNKNP